MTGNVQEAIAVREPRNFNDEQLATLRNWDDVQAVALEQGIAAVDFSDFGTGFTVLTTDEKRTLVDVELAVLDWRFNVVAETGGEFVSLVILTRDGRKVIVNDGSTGIFAQMRTITEKLGDARPILTIPKGLRASDYFYVDEKGVKRPATTYYLNNSK